MRVVVASIMAAAGLYQVAHEYETNMREGMWEITI